jgi:hypothetical protein
MMKTMNISDSTYHIKMLQDLATQNKTPMLLAVDKGDHAEITVIGGTVKVLALLTSMIDDISEETDVSIEFLFAMIGDTLRKKREREHDKS